MKPHNSTRARNQARTIAEERLRERATEEFMNALEREMFRRHGVITVYYEHRKAGTLSAQREAFVDCQLRHPEIDLTLEMVRFVPIDRKLSARAN